MNSTTLTNCVFPTTDFEKAKERVLNFAQGFSTFCFLDNHQYHITPHSQECLLAAGLKRQVKANSGTALEQLQGFIDQDQSWLFGHLGFDLKNETEHLSSGHPDGIGFPDLFFFEPELLIRLSPTEMIIEADDPQLVYGQLAHTSNPSAQEVKVEGISRRFSREEYLEVIGQLKQHILRGDCYEINFCQEFFAANTRINPIHVYKQLSLVSPNPFSALYKVEGKWLICASPERFLKKEGDKLFSQPIKGTSKRVPFDKELDQSSRSALQQSAKDRSENVMVVDLVRNDLARVCEEGTVIVEELFGLYSFPQVHQLISTVSGHLRKNVSFTEIINATFPMGSMTGAPKRRVMELIERYERTKRGIFSGAVGYINPDGDFDFNVVIRSIMYNEATGYLSFQAGSGITFYSEAEEEWKECLLKAAAIEQVLGTVAG